MPWSWRKTVSLPLIPAVLLTLPYTALGADVRTDIAELQAEIQNKKAEVESISNRLDEYRARIQEYQKKSKSLASDVALLENEQAIVELDIASLQAQMESEVLEMQLLDEQMKTTDEDLAKKRAALKDVLFSLNAQDRQEGSFEVLLSAQNVHEVFRSVAQLVDMNADLQKRLVAAQDTRVTLEKQKGAREERLATLEGLSDDLEKQIGALESSKNAKLVLMSETEESESTYKELLEELRQEQQDVSARITALQDSVTQRLLAEDTQGNVSGSTVISWPIEGIITTTFHDPTYPFRYLFEHSGLDIAVAQGTAIEAAAPGVVAWARTGRMYGNYVMIIHANGLATLYAHMSRIDVVQDQYVSRGQIIGLSGGRAGSPGAGFSTGPHVHFEVREDGIPVDPYRFLP